MKLVAESGSWGTGPIAADPPAAAVLEVSGAVLSWTVDDPTGPGSTHVAFTDVEAAEWLWRVVGQAGHVALLAALAGRVPEAGQIVDVAGVEPAPELLAPLRRLAVGHWLRRWWPASSRDGIVSLDAAVLDGELALLTVAAQDYFTDDTFDSDVADLLRPHRAALAALVGDGDPRVAELARACTELADDVGLARGPESALPEPQAARRRDDYALAAGSDSAATSAEQVARGVGSLNWTAVPPGVFDAADRTVDWAIELSGATATADVRVAISAPVAGIEVRLRAGPFSAAGVLSAAGRASLPVVDAAGRPVPEVQAWNHDWTTTTVSVGADVGDSEAGADVRRRLRDFARARLARPAADAFLAESLAAESDY